MTMPTNTATRSSGAVSARDYARERVCAFWASAIQRAGGVSSLATLLFELGYTGRDAELSYSPRTIRAWRAGARMAPADVREAVALALWVGEYASSNTPSGVIAAVDEVAYEIERMLGLCNVPQLSQLRYWRDRLRGVRPVAGEAPLQ